MSHIKISKKMVIIILLLLVAGGILGYALTRNDTPSNQSQAVQKEDNSTVNFSPPTETERTAADEQKQKNESEQIKRNENAGGQTAVKPVITSAGQFDTAQFGNAIEVRTLVTGVYEEGGKCTATIVQNTHRLTKTVEALQDATTTRCDVIVVPRSEFPSSGEWTVVVDYTSASSKGQSDAVKVEVR